MKVLITGGQGFIGRKLALALADRGQIGGQDITHITLADIVDGPLPQSDIGFAQALLDLSDRDAVNALFETPYDVIFHLAAIVSGVAEADYDLGQKVNLHGTLHLFEAARASQNAPCVVYASSCAAHGGNEPDPVPEYVELNPQTSYGTQKVIGELLLNDMSRRGFIDGRGLRLPTVTIRPGKPNGAASSFMSSIFREPLQGESANCPVSEDYLVWHTAPRTIVQNLIHAAEIDSASMGYNRNINLPGRADTIGQMITAMTKVAGSNAAGLITWNPDKAVQDICEGWRGQIAHETATNLGFVADTSFENSVAWFLQDDIAQKS